MAEFKNIFTLLPSKNTSLFANSVDTKVEIKVVNDRKKKPLCLFFVFLNEM